ncbi:methyltransferase domain-containing protein [Candidatus Aerophobetes bacterium]|nr:methyltransferase domain-containing protein [Candidatus Aerophobetes bacterium]
MKRQSAIINIAAGSQQVLVIKKIKELGLKVISVDKNINAPGFSLSDFCINESTYEPDRIIDKLKKIQNRYEFKGVIGRSSGPPVFTVAKIADEFNLRGLPSDVAKLLFNKSKLLPECFKRNISVPWSVSTYDLNKINFDSIRYPVVIKPSIGLVGKKGVFYIDSKEELIKNFNYTQKTSYNGQVHIEEYIDGYDVTLMLIVYNRKPYIYATIDEITKVNSNSNFVNKVHITPSKSNPQTLNNLKRITNSFIEKFGIEDGILGITFRVNKNMQKIIEVNGDLGGDNLLDILLPLSTKNFDILKEIILSLNGKEPNFNINKRDFAFLYNTNGTTKKVNKKYIAEKANSYEECINRIREIEENLWNEERNSLKKEDSNINLKYINCPLCNSNNYVGIYHHKAEWLNIEYTNVVCKNCGFIFRNPTMDWEKYLQLYKNSGNLLSSSQYINYEEGSRPNKLRKERLKFLFDNISFNKGTILDIGGGDGFFLDGFDRTLWNKVMVEPGEGSKTAIKKSIKVFELGIEEFNYSKKFDIITCISVLEHLLNPKIIVKKIFKLLAKDGYLFLEIPNSLTPSIKISEFYSFEHLCGFTLNNLQYLLNLEGFKIIAIDNATSIPNLRIIARKGRRIVKNIPPKSDYLKIIDVVNEYKLKRTAFENEIKERLKNVFDGNCHNKIAVYGAGNHTIQLLNTINFLNKNNILCFLDSNIHKQGNQFLGKPVLAPEQLEFLDVGIVVISSGCYQDEMYKRIKKFEGQGKIKVIKLYPEGTI